MSAGVAAAVIAGGFSSVIAFFLGVRKILGEFESRVMQDAKKDLALNELFDPQTGWKATTRDQQRLLEEMRRQILPNGGRSMADKVGQIADSMSSLDRTVAAHIQDDAREFQAIHDALKQRSQ
jgi:hypothetical protein